MSPTHICLCTFRRCYTKIDPKTGKQGVALPIRTFNLHQEQEKEHLRRTAFEDVQQATLNRQIDSIANNLESMSIRGPDSTQPQPSPKNTDYRADHKKKIIHSLSMAQEHIHGLKQSIMEIGMAPSNYPPLNQIDFSIERCCQIRQSAEEPCQVLAFAMNSSLKKEHSVKYMCQELQESVDDLILLIKNVKGSWIKAQLESRELEVLRSGETIFSSDHHFDAIFAEANSIVQVVSLMVVACSVILGLPRRGCLWLFEMSAYVIEITVSRALSNGKIPQYFERLFKSFPRDVRASTANFHLESEATIYAVCPKCHATYKPDGPKDMPIYKDRCNSDKFSNRCGEILLRPRTIRDRIVYLPIKPYVVYDFPAWIANLMSRSGYETLMDNAWTGMTGTENGHLRDVFGGSVIREFKGPDRETHFSNAGDQTSGRYLFSMGFDFFNPLRNMANGKKVSIGVIAIVCLNLPIHLRYKPENIFLAAIIPGPKEPKLDEINHYIRPIIDVFIQLWNGIRFTRTSLYEHGRLVFCALLVIICDLPAARKIGGFASCNHEYFCSICWCTKTQHTYNNYDYRSWKRRTPEDCKARANRFSDAPTAKDAQCLFDRSGIRCSELWRLPYYDPTKHLVVDPMHNLFLGLIKEHFQNILGYIPKGTTDKRRPAALPLDPITLNLSYSEHNPLPEHTKERASVRKLVSYLKDRLDFDQTDAEAVSRVIKRWSMVHTSALVYVGKSIGCLPLNMTPDGKDMSTAFPVRTKKTALAEILLTWRLRQSERPEPVSRGPIVPGLVLTHDEIKAIWSDIESVVKPSWATSVPPTITSVGPKLKSDQWRSVGSLFLPVSLIRLWGNDNGNQERKDLLHLTMLLCSAVCIATSRVVSSTQAEAYIDQMTQYRRELHRIFPGYQCHPNHHMAMHVGEFLSLYGPMHGWWTFPFERMIGSLQRIQTNYKTGQYEKTISRSWHRSSNFRALFLKESSPIPIKNCVDMFNTLVRPPNRNSLAEIFAPGSLEVEEVEEENEMPFESEHSISSTRKIPLELMEALQAKVPSGSAIPSSAMFRTRITVKDITYSIPSVHEGNSCVLIKGSSRPFSIVNILDIDTAGTQTWFFVRRHRKAAINTDPYKKYPALRAEIWSNDLHPEIEAIPLSQVDTHFAKCRLVWEGKDVIVAISLSKVNVV